MPLTSEQQRLVFLLQKPGLTKQAWDTMDTADLGLSLIPGVGNAWGAGRSLQAAGNSFSEGNVLGGLGHTALAGINMIPAVGPVAGKLLRAGSKFLGPAARVASKPWAMPTFSRLASPPVRGTQNALKFFDRYGGYTRHPTTGVPTYNSFFGRPYPAMGIAGLGTMGMGFQEDAWRKAQQPQGWDLSSIFGNNTFMNPNG